MPRKKTTAPAVEAPTVTVPTWPPVPLQDESPFVWLTRRKDNRKDRADIDHGRARQIIVDGVPYEYCGDEDGVRVYRDQRPG